MKNVGATILDDANGLLWKSKALTAGNTYYSKGMSVKRSTGYSSLLILTDASITVSFQVSYDDSNYYDPYDKNGTALGGIVTALASDKWIVISPQIAVYMRIKVVCNSNATTTLTFIQAEED